MKFDKNRIVGIESRKSYTRKLYTGFINRYLSGENVLEIGGTGDGSGSSIVERAINIDFGYPGYDGLRLPFADGSQDAVYSSHCLEHMPDPIAALREWFRVLRVGGFLVIAVPHQLLYEKKARLPSRFAGGHLRFYLPHTFLSEIFQALPLTEYRIREFYENDEDFDYSIPPHLHSTGCYEMEIIIEKISPYPHLQALLSD